MTGPVPILVGGIGQDQGIWETRTTAAVKVGTRGYLPDGRVFYYSRQSSSNAIVAGNLLSSESASVDYDDMVTSTAALGATSITCTNVGTATAAANDFAEGYACVNSATTGAGTLYKVRSHLIWAATSAVVVNLYDPLPVALTGTVRTHIHKNPWQDVLIMPTSGAGQPAGVSQIAVVAGNTDARYFWAQTWGVACVTAGSASAIGDALMADTGTAGETLIATAGTPVIGNAYTLGVNGDFVQCFLTIAP